VRRCECRIRFQGDASKDLRHCRGHQEMGACLIEVTRAFTTSAPFPSCIRPVTGEAACA
jgi:hypothetical protein